MSETHTTPTATKRHLGQGLLGEKTFYMADPTTILFGKMWKTLFNPRSDFGDMNELRDSVYATGVNMPLKVRRTPDGQLELTHGERRLRATLAARKLAEERLAKDANDAGALRALDLLKSIPVVLVPRGTVDEDILLEHITLNTGKALQPVEEGELFADLVKRGMTVEAIADKIGRTAATVTKRLLLASAAPELKDAVKQKKVGASLASRVVRKSKGDQGKQAAAAKQATGSKAGKQAVKQAAGAASSGTFKKRHLEVLLQNLYRIKGQLVAGSSTDTTLHGLVDNDKALLDFIADGGRYGHRAAYMRGLIEGLLIAYNRDGSSPTAILEEHGLSYSDYSEPEAASSKRPSASKVVDSDPQEPATEDPTLPAGAPKYPQVKVAIDATAGPLNMIGAVAKGLKHAGTDTVAIQAFRAEALRVPPAQVMGICQSWVTVS